jgi:flagellar L-ring protein precursor FlgH
MDDLDMGDSNLSSAVEAPQRSAPPGVLDRSGHSSRADAHRVSLLRPRSARAMTSLPILCFGICASMLAGCGGLSRLAEVGRPPEMTPTADPTKDPKWRPLTMPGPAPLPSPREANALWRPGSRAFFKDQRAAQVGDIITVLVNMKDSANLTNDTTASRTSSETAGLPNLFGLESIVPKTVTMSSLVSGSSGNTNVGSGQIQRNEAVTLRLAGIITQVLPNGNLVVAARQEFMVNSELRDLEVTGVIRPQDIGSDNTVPHDRMAEARISYGGRGNLTDLQRARWGQQMLDILMPF